MPLSETQEEEMYANTLTACTSITWIKERLEAGDKKLLDCDKRLNDLEVEHSLLKGRLGAFILGLTFIVSLLVNGILWAWSHIGGGKS
jgi:hypothetical protein